MVDVRDKWGADWSGFSKDKAAEPEHPLSRPLNKNVKTGADIVNDLVDILRGDNNFSAGNINDVAKAAKDQIALPTQGAIQPSQQEIINHLKKLGFLTEDQLKKADETWGDVFTNFFKSVTKPVEDPNSKDNKDWGNRNSVYDGLTDEEKAERNMYVSENE
jgi:hypothetical protein